MGAGCDHYSLIITSATNITTKSRIAIECNVITSRLPDVTLRDNLVGLGMSL